MRQFSATFACVCMLSGGAVAEGFDADRFDRFVSARAGDGEPVYWYSTGTVRAYPSGELLFTMEGFDTARSHRPDPDAPLVHQYSRKIYIFRDPATGEVVRTYGEGEEAREATPIAYPYQFITYELKGDAVETFVEQGAGARMNRIGPGDTMVARDLGDTLVVSAPLFLDFPIPGAEARYQAWENYDFLIQPDGAVEEPHQLSWARFGPLPPWAGGGPSIMHLITWRVEAFDDLPDAMKAYIETDAPLWTAPPADLADIRKLQE